MRPTRRTFLDTIGRLAGLALATPAFAQPIGGSDQTSAKFGYADVVRRARDLGAASYDTTNPALPDQLTKLDYDSWRDIRFRQDKSLLGGGGGPFKMQMHHLGFLFKQAITVNIIRDGVPTPIPYSASLFDYGKNKFERPLPVNLGFAGFRVSYPLNDPRQQDELISFLGASYFRFLGRGQRYGLSARGLALGTAPNTAQPEEFPNFREFWIEQPSSGAERVVIHALLDSPSVTGAYQFIVYPAQETVMDVTVTLFARRSLNRVGIAPLTSMFFVGENDRRFTADFRPELHDSDGLLMQTGAGEWIWRPLRNPVQATTSSFLDSNPRGFGLMQRDRLFEHYQDLDLGYESRPSYWIEPRGDWGDGRIDLVELPTADETNDNIVAFWSPRNPLEPGQAQTWGYRIKALTQESKLHPGGRAVNSYQTVAKALGSNEAPASGSKRFIIDFAGGDLSYYQSAPDTVQIVPTTTAGKITRTFLVPNSHIDGFRAGIDVALEPGQTADLRAFLKSGTRALTETWTYPWKAE